MPVANGSSVRFSVFFVYKCNKQHSFVSEGDRIGFSSDRKRD